MGCLDFQPVQLNLSASVVDAMREELASGGMSSGTILVGSLGAMPELLYILWHQAGELPVSITIRDPKEDVSRARLAAREFVDKWRQFTS